jgi:hypothetical protein
MTASNISIALMVVVIVFSADHLSSTSSNSNGAAFKTSLHLSRLKFRTFASTDSVRPRGRREDLMTLGWTVVEQWRSSRPMQSAPLFFQPCIEKAKEQLHDGEREANSCDVGHCMLGW